MVKRSTEGLSQQEKKILWRISILVVMLGLLWLLFAPNKGFLYQRKLHNQLDALSLENNQLERQNREMSKEIQRLKTDDAYLEELARNEYGLLKKNETVYKFGSAKKKK